MRMALKKYWLFLLLGIVALVLISLKLFLGQQKTTPPASTAELSAPVFIQEKVTNNIINYQIDFSLNASFPNSLPVYQLASIKTDSFPAIEPNYGGPAVITSDPAATTRAKEFLKEKGVEDRFTEISSLSYLGIDKSETFVATSSAEIDVYVVGFWSKIKGLTVVSNGPKSPLSYVWVGKNGQIQKALATTFSEQEIKPFPLRSLETAARDITSQKGSLVWLEKDNDYGFSPAVAVGSIILERVSLAYFLPTNDSKIIEPIYVFEGKAFLLDGKIINTAVYLPAVEEKYLSFGS